MTGAYFFYTLIVLFMVQKDINILRIFHEFNIILFRNILVNFY